MGLWGVSDLNDVVQNVYVVYLFVFNDEGCIGFVVRNCFDCIWKDVEVFNKEVFFIGKCKDCCCQLFFVGVDY